LRQDFSVSFPTLRRRAPAPGLPAVPTLQPVRFDYVVRTRPVAPRERKRWEVVEGNPQREAVLFALRDLTRQDHGDATVAWERAFPLAGPEVRSARLADRLVTAEAIDRLALIARYRDAEGLEHAWALRRAIPRLAGPAQEVARRALADRLARTPTTELRQRLGNTDSENLRAAMLACLEKDDPAFVPELIGVLAEGSTLAPLARAGLRKLTGQDLPDADAYRAWQAASIPARQ
jgi:hypothetical protein